MEKAKNVNVNVFNCAVYSPVKLYKFVHLLVWNNLAILLNCTLTESFINVRVPKFVLMYGSYIPRKGIWFWFDTGSHI